MTLTVGTPEVESLSLAFGARCARRIAATSTAARVDLPSTLARRTGHFRGAPVELTATAWAGGAIAYARVVTIAGPGLSIVQVLGLPAGPPPLRAAPALPILNVDVVALDRAPVVVTADFSPTGDAGVDDGGLAVQLAGRRRRHAPFPDGGALPARCGRWFSPQHLHTRLPSDRAGAAIDAAFDFVDAWLGGAAAVGPNVADSLHPRVETYCADHRTEDAALPFLDRMFGPGWTTVFKVEVLFPRRGGWALGDLA